MTQEQRVLEYLQNKGPLTSRGIVEEFDFVDGRKIISSLRRAGHNIGDTWIYRINKYGDPVQYKRYFLIPEASGYQSTFA